MSDLKLQPMKLIILLFLALSLPIMITHGQASQQKQPVLTELQKIDKLYEYLESQKEVSFCRNGSYYDVSNAISHLKIKQEKVGSGAKTARGFISNVATKSSMSGIAYTIKYPDGKVVALNDILTKKLLEIEANE